MSDTLPMHSSEVVPMTTEVLEIGAGIDTETALFHKGELLDKPNVGYTGIDLPMLYWPEKGGYNAALNVKGAPVASEGAGFVAANAKNLPFRDETFDFVLMRSVFGELSMDDAFQSSDLSSVRSSLPETRRVLKSGGKIIIAEENTPFDPTILLEWVVESGFEIEDIAFMNSDYGEESGNSEWESIRNLYYKGKPTSTEPGNYVLVATKP